ncbi:MAG: SUMF1/EgtB/PvdO family nonheme iron enzyme, partial [Prevotella sp.]|nr:SUMF1/EgtB/PvdO family nonheme iron enzyme [Prevotellaceae bacterium]MDY5251005.1 SUMF1/EgtB/PvdO family nonheme iron enzyme [Prevotella sp.]
SYSSAAQTNPTGASSGSYRVYRGGSWGSSARGCRSSNRSYNAPGARDNLLGLRLALSE